MKGRHKTYIHLDAYYTFGESTMSDDKLVRASIRVFKDIIFYEQRNVQQINIKYGNLTAILHVVTIPKDLQVIFQEAHIDWTPETHEGDRVKKQIKGLDFDEIESADDDHLRIRLSALTKSAIQNKLQTTFEWLDVHNIDHGEKDGKAACIFKCLTSEQLEIGEF